MNTSSKRNVGRVHNTNIQVRGRKAMQHPSKGTTMYNTNIRSLSPPLERHVFGDDRGGDGYGGERRFRERGYESREEDYGEVSDRDEGELDEDTSDGGEAYQPRGATEKRGNAGTEDFSTRSDSADTVVPYPPYPGYPGRRTDINSSEPIMAHNRASHLHDDNSMDVTASRQAAMNSSRSNLRQSIEYDQNSDNGQMHSANITGSSQLDNPFTSSSTSQVQLDRPKPITTRLDDVIDFACEWFEVENANARDLVVGVIDDPDEGCVMLGSLLVEYAKERLGRNLKDLMIVDRAKMRELRDAVSERDKRIQNLEERLRFVEEYGV